MRIKNWQNRALFISAAIVLSFVALAFSAKVFRENIIYFYSPTDLIEKAVSPSAKTLRVGGLVSGIKKIDDLTIEFTISDEQNSLIARFKGIPPALFTEGQGTIATGNLEQNKLFLAKEILAKHDENYMPKEVAESLKKSGRWKD